MIALRQNALGVFLLLLVIEIGIIAVEGDQFLVGACLHDLSFFQDYDPVEIKKGKDPVGDDDGCLML
jgi:hypothetical protein